MRLNSIQIYDPEQFGNGWGFYVDLENSHIPITNYGFVSGKYRRNYYNCYDKIDEELEYYQYEYNKKKEENLKQIEDNSLQIEETNIIKTDTTLLLFNITSTTLITLAISYYIFCVL